METNKRSTSEVGHAKNVAQLQKLIAKCKMFYADYNPPNPLIYISELTDLHTTSEDAIRYVHQAKNTADIFINERQIEFQKLSTIATRTVNILAVIANEPRIVADARTILRRIRGEASKPKTKDNEQGQEVARPRSNSQKSYDKLTDHFVALVELVRHIPAYLPNESDITVAALSDYLAELVLKNNNVIKGNAELAKARNQRDKILYDPVTGLFNRSKLVKLYIKSLYGTTSTEYKEVNAIRFRKD